MSNIQYCWNFHSICTLPQTNLKALFLYEPTKSYLCKLPSQYSQIPSHKSHLSHQSLQNFCTNLQSYHKDLSGCLEPIKKSSLIQYIPSSWMMWRKSSLHLQFCHLEFCKQFWSVYAESKHLKGWYANPEYRIFLLPGSLNLKFLGPLKVAE